MTLLHRIDQALLSSAFGRTLLGLPSDPQPSPWLVGRLTLVLLVVCGTWCGVRRSELERAASETRSRDFENRLRDLILSTRNESVAATERAEEAAVGALRSSLCGLEAQAASADVAAATTARAYLALLEREGLTADLPELAQEFNDGDPLP
jgi:hypothetical protein